MRKLMRLIVLLLCACLLSSCSGKEFKFDEAITWNSAYEDIMKKYGEPDETKLKTDTDDIQCMIYNNFICCGIDGFTLIFYIDKKTDKIIEIRVKNYSYSDFSKGKNDYDTIVKALSQKYGLPTNSEQNHTSKYDNDISEWVQSIKDTYIKIYYFKSSYYGECRIDLTYETTANLQINGI